MRGATSAFSARRGISTCCAPVLIGFVIGVLTMLAMPDDRSHEGNEGQSSSTYQLMTDFISGRGQSTYGGGKRYKYVTAVGGDREAADTGSPIAAAESVAPSPSPAPVEKQHPEDTHTGPIMTGDLAYLQDTAIITLATGDKSAKDAVALLQSLRDVNTQVPTLLVLLSRGGMGSEDCKNVTWKQINSRQHVSCSSLDTIEPEIASQRYLDIYAKLGVQTLIVDPVPDTPYTTIPGGRQTFWGMAFNKLLVFGMTKYKKIMWMDSDAYVIKNIDHLMKEPTLTGAIVTACCNPNGPGYAGGGIWILEPSTTLYADLMDFIAKPVPGTEKDPWYV
jgi:hypothetical protein